VPNAHANRLPASQSMFVRDMNLFFLILGCVSHGSVHADSVCVLTCNILLLLLVFCVFHLLAAFFSPNIHKNRQSQKQQKSPLSNRMACFSWSLDWRTCDVKRVFLVG